MVSYRRFSWAVVLLVVVGLLVLVGLLLATRWKYEAEVTLQIRADPESLDCRTQMALVRSRPVLMTALKDPKVAALPSVRSRLEPIQWMAGRLKVDFS